MEGEEYVQQLTDIAISSTRMLKYKIDDIMDYALLETDTIRINHGPGTIRDMLNEVQDILKLQFDHSMIKFSVFISDNVPETVFTDHKRIKQVLLNLVFNALKYTERGFVLVIVDCEYPQHNKVTKYKGYDKCKLRFSVSDTGCGIEKKKRMNIFNLFSSANSKHNEDNSEKYMMESSELMGIGLAFCHQILKKMHSELKLTSTINIGSTFNFSLEADFPSDHVEEIIVPANVSIGGFIQNNESMQMIAMQAAMKNQTFDGLKERV